MLDNQEDNNQEVALSDPTVVNSSLLDGMTITRASDGGMRCVGWEAIRNEAGDIVERRVVLRFGLTAEGVAQSREQVQRLCGQEIESPKDRSVLDMLVKAVRGKLDN
jgi:hypothetical protein